jgi:hypothetical protein
MFSTKHTLHNTDIKSGPVKEPFWKLKTGPGREPFLNKITAMDNVQKRNDCIDIPS